MDSDDDLDLPPPKPTINLDDSDSDDDLPPPAVLAAMRSPPPRPTAAPVVAPLRLTSPNSGGGSPLTKIQVGAASNGKASLDPQVQLQSPADSKARANPAKVYKEGFLLKQQPSWPYSNQKRYCVLKNCKLYYFDSQESMKEGRPQGVIDLTNAKLVDPGNEAKLPSNFGIRVEHDKQTEGGNNSSSNKKQRTFIFSVTHAHELGEWKAAVRSIVGDDIEEDQVHWFDKMVQGVY
ncbi:hypothetical protein DQ04_02051040 [Trypanosoma grayi]|uniref:hypothetical protein n=1 Tax=Trypanosoma grayi TaxID=71804 RepID=UPI0004F4B5C1|nr:hypothetical protein DQ04_02051040 [Trypanosoma grayi]KEG12039.1 hypothetical protein DQ04_02051040 [Trypanosoma grayi]